MKKTRLILGVIVLLFSGFLAFNPGLVAADAARDAACEGLGDALGSGNCDEGDSASSLSNTFSSVISVLSIVLGVISVIMMIIAGFKFVTSGGESGSVASARNTVIYALVGLVIAAIAQFVVRFVIGRL